MGSLGRSGIRRAGAPAGGGEANTSSNVGTGEGLALPKVVFDLPFKSLLDTALEIIITSQANTLTFALAAGILISKLESRTLNHVFTFGPAPTSGFIVNANVDPGAAIAQSKLAAILKADLPATVVHTDQINTYGAFAQIFRGNEELRIRNSGNTFSYLFQTSGITADRRINLPLLTSDGDFVLTNFPNVFGNGVRQSFEHSPSGVGIRIIQIAATPPMTFNGDLAIDSIGMIFRHSSINQRVVTLGQTQTLQNKTLDSTNSVDIAALPVGTAFQRYRTNSGASAIENFTESADITFVIGDGSNVITTGIKVFIRLPFDCEVERWTVMSLDASSSIVVDINRYTSLANYDAGTKASIAGSDLPTLVSDKSNESTALTGWTTVLNQGDILEAEVDSITTATRVTISLRLNKRG